MKSRIHELTVIFLSTIKWTMLAIIIGVLAGTTVSFFIKTLDFSINLTSNIPYYYFLPLIFIINVFFVEKISPESKGHGTEKVIEAVHKKNGEINWRVIPVKLFTSVITIAFGGSVGKEGPAAQIGGGIASVFSNIFKFDKTDKKKLVICGISAGFAAIFGTPIAGAIFGVEVLFIGNILYDVLLPSFISGIIAYHTASSLGVEYFNKVIHTNINFTPEILLKVILFGSIMGILSFIFISTMNFFEKLFHTLKGSSYKKAVLGALFIILLSFILGKDYLGLGIEQIKMFLNGHRPVWYSPLAKILFTSITLGFGGSGGVLTPIFFIGASAGSVLSPLFNINPQILAAIGLVSFLSGTTNTPIASSIMAIEFFGPDIAPYAALACIVGFLASGHTSIYPAQVLAIKKTKAVKIDLGKEVSQIEPETEIEEAPIIKETIEFTEEIADIIKTEFHKLAEELHLEGNHHKKNKNEKEK